MAQKLTRLLIDKATTSPQESWIWDSILPGFGVRLFKTGVKSYFIRYRNQFGRQRKLAVARCCDMSPEQARNLARQLFAQIASGEDPLVDRRAKKHLTTMQDLYEKYMTDHAPRKKPKSIREDKSIWRLHILPNFQDRSVMDIQEKDILSLHTTMRETKYIANRTLALLSKALNLAEMWGMRPKGTNPCMHIKKYKEEPREKILNAEDLQRLGNTLDILEREKRFSGGVIPLIRLLLYTGCRLSEILEAEWSWVDMERSLLILPDSKVGKRVVHLSPVALNVLKNLERNPLDRWIIRGKSPEKPLTYPRKAWAKICQHADLSGFRLHDLRHTVGSMGHRAGLSQRQIATLLGHKQLSTTARYLHSLASDEQKAATITAAAIDQYLSSSSNKGDKKEEIA